MSFSGFKNTLNVSEEPTLQELIWARLKLHNKQPIYICSFFRTPNNLLELFSSLNDSLNKLFTCNTQFLTVIVAGDFNLPDIMWIDGHGSIKSNPAYRIEINSFFLDTLNDYGLEQLLKSHQGMITFWISFCLHILILRM